MICIVVALVAVLTAVSAKVYFKENFNDAAWIDRWTVPSQWKPQVCGCRSSLINDLTNFFEKFD